MLADAERRLAALEQAMRETSVPRAPVVAITTAVKRYLLDLQATLVGNVDEARRMLSLAVDKIVLRTEGEHVVARIAGNMAGLLTISGLEVASVGAGRGILSLPPRPPVVRALTGS